jgi:hypothetical protein
VRGNGCLGALRRGVVVAAALAVSSCGALQNMVPDPADFHPIPKASNLLPQNVEAYSRPVSVAPPRPQDLVDGEGRCFAADASPATARGIGLKMTECEVVATLGPPQSAQIEPRSGDQRVAVLTYLGGDRPGIYRFNGGRLVSIERGSEPPPVEKKPPAKKPRPAPSQ